MNTAPEVFLLQGGVNVNALPKVSLHDHLDGGLRPQTIIELADEVGLDLPESTADTSTGLSASAALADWFSTSSDSGSLVEYLKTFDVTTGVMQTTGGLARVAREFVEDLHADGVIYGEIRWAPEQHLGRGLSLDQAVEAVQDGIDAGIEEVQRAGGRIRIGQLLSAMRQADRALEVAELAVRHRDNGVVGFDLAGPEAGYPAGRMRDAFDYLAKNYLPVTVHAGEADGVDSIRGALFDGRALRLGHGVRIAEDIELDGEDGENTYVTLGPVAEWVRDRGIALELSPTSNLQTNAWGTELDEHPFDLLYQLGFRVTVNTDNRLMSRTSLSRELSRLSDTFGYNIGDLKVFQLNAAEAAFLPIEDREELAIAISTGFERA